MAGVTIETSADPGANAHRHPAQAETKERHRQAASRPRVLKQDQVPQRDSILHSQKPKAGPLLPSSAQTTSGILFFPNGQAFPSSWSVPWASLPASCPPLLSLGYPWPPASHRNLKNSVVTAEERTPTQFPHSPSHPKILKSKAPFSHPSTAF